MKGGKAKRRRQQSNAGAQNNVYTTTRPTPHLVLDNLLAVGKNLNLFHFPRLHGLAVARVQVSPSLPAAGDDGLAAVPKSVSVRGVDQQPVEFAQSSASTTRKTEQQPKRPTLS